MNMRFRCPAGIGAARPGTVSSPRLLLLMKNAALSVSDSICASTNKCSGMSCTLYLVINMYYIC